MSDQAVQNIVSSAKTAVGIFFDLTKLILKGLQDRANGTTKKIEELEKSGKADKAELKKLQDMQKAQQSAFGDIQAQYEIVKEAKGEVEKMQPDQQIQMSKDYDNAFIGELKKQGVTTEMIKDAKNKGGIDKVQGLESKVKSAQVTALSKVTDSWIKKNHPDFSMSMANLMKGQDKESIKFQNKIKASIEKSNELKMDLNNKDNLDKIGQKLNDGPSI